MSFSKDRLASTVTSEPGDRSHRPSAGRNAYAFAGVAGPFASFRFWFRRMMKRMAAIAATPERMVRGRLSVKPPTKYPMKQAPATTVA